MIRLTCLAIACLLPLAVSKDKTPNRVSAAAIAESADAGWVRGFTEPVRLTDVAASEDGNIAVIHVRRGQRVQPGQVLVTLDKELLEAQVSIARARSESTAAIDAAKIRLARARHRFDKIQQLRSAGLGSAEELDAAQSDVDLALTQLAEATDAASLNKLELNRIETALRKRDIVSPTPGVVTQIHREVGEFVSPAERVVVTIAKLNELRIPIYVSGGQAARLKAGQQLAVRFSNETAQATATIDYISPISDPGSGTVLVELLINNENGARRSGIACSVAVTS